MAPSRRGGRTWTSLSPSYRKRLEGAGVTREQWLAGADLRGARGRKPTPGPTAAPKGPTERLIEGEATEDDIDALDRWRDNDAPSWLPNDEADLSTDVAAALSRLGMGPEQWGYVNIRPVANGEPWTMTVTPTAHVDRNGVVRTHAYDVSVEIPGGGAPQTTGAWEVLNFMAEYWDYYDDVDRWDVEGS